MRNDQHDSFDALIDEAAHALTRQTPPPALRANVRERIARPWRLWSLAPALAGAAALLVAVVVGLDVFVAPDVQDQIAADRASARGAREQARPSDPPAARSAAILQPTRRVQSIRRASAPMVAAEEEPPIPPLTIEPLTVPQIVTVANTGAMPIEIAPLRIDPIPDAGGERTNDSQLPALGL